MNTIGLLKALVIQSQFAPEFFLKALYILTRLQGLQTHTMYHITQSIYPVVHQNYGM